MSPCLCIVLAAAVAAAPAPATSASPFDRLERHMQELVEQQRFDDLARDGEAAFGRVDLLPWQRRELAFYAVRGYHGVYTTTGRSAGLCQARGLLRRIEREVGLEDDGPTAARLRGVNEAHLRELGPSDPCVADKQAPVAAPVPAPVPAPVAAPVAPPEHLLPVKVDGAVVSHRTPPATSQSSLLNTSRRRPPRAGDSSTLAAARPLAQPPPRSRSRIAGGSVLLVLGAGLGAGMTAALVQRSYANSRIVMLSKRIDAEDRKPTAEEFASVSRDARSYHQLTVAAGFLGAAAGVATVAGIALLTTPRRGRTTTASLTASPWSTTLTLSGRF